MIHDKMATVILDEIVDNYYLSVSRWSAPQRSSKINEICKFSHDK